MITINSKSEPGKVGGYLFSNPACSAISSGTFENLYELLNIGHFLFRSDVFCLYVPELRISISDKETLNLGHYSVTQKLELYYKEALMHRAFEEKEKPQRGHHS
ncbi:MAG: hypothetical protein JJE22_07680 [Bacteroidia bacterium]|nr:hypothetical protein [Bacteroidia bacterium]